MIEAKHDAAVLAAFDVMLRGVEGAQRRGVTMPYAQVNGNTYAMISRDVIGIRLSEKDLATFIVTYNAWPFEPIPGIVQKEYAAVPSWLLKDEQTLQIWSRLSYAYASRLPARPTRS